MAAKVFFLLALTAVVVCAENDCICALDTKMKTDDLWKFLNKLSPNHIEPKDKERYVVLPGVLSALVDCDCLEKNNRKRTMLPEAEETFGKLESLQPEGKEHLRLKKSIHFKTVRCPQGHAWFGVMCVPEEYLD